MYYKNWENYVLPQHPYSALQLHPEGVVQVTFEEVESADMCVATLNKRLYGGRTLYVTTWDGKEKFK